MKKAFPFSISEFSIVTAQMSRHHFENINPIWNGVEA